MAALPDKIAYEMLSALETKSDWFMFAKDHALVLDSFHAAIAAVERRRWTSLHPQELIESGCDLGVTKSEIAMPHDQKPTDSHTARKIADDALIVRKCVVGSI
jgi:hypothetical protein